MDDTIEMESRRNQTSEILQLPKKRNYYLIDFLIIVLSIWNLQCFQINTSFYDGLYFNIPYLLGLCLVFMFSNLMSFIGRINYLTIALILYFLTNYIYHNKVDRPFNVLFWIIILNKLALKMIYIVIIAIILHNWHKHLYYVISIFAAITVWGYFITSLIATNFISQVCFIFLFLLIILRVQCQQKTTKQCFTLFYTEIYTFKTFIDFISLIYYAQLVQITILYLLQQITHNNRVFFFLEFAIYFFLIPATNYIVIVKNINKSPYLIIFISVLLIYSDFNLAILVGIPFLAFGAFKLLFCYLQLIKYYDIIAIMSLFSFETYFTINQFPTLIIGALPILLLYCYLKQ